MSDVAAKIFGLYLDVVITGTPWDRVAEKSGQRSAAIIRQIHALGLPRRTESPLEDCVILTALICESVYIPLTGSPCRYGEFCGLELYGEKVHVGEFNIVGENDADIMALRTVPDDYAERMQCFSRAVYNWSIKKRVRMLFAAQLDEKKVDRFSFRFEKDHWQLIRNLKTRLERRHCCLITIRQCETGDSCVCSVMKRGLASLPEKPAEARYPTTVLQL
jgi:hypothetical protein